MEEEFRTQVDTKKTVREILAVNRTRLANERTFLAYLRTSATFLIAGISLLKLFNHILMQVTGMIFLAAAVLISIYGVIKFDSLRQLTDFESKNLINHKNDANLTNVPRLMWNMLGRVYSRLTLHGK